MILKRILFLLTITLTIFTLSACGDDKELEIYSISVTSNVDEVNPIYFESSIIDGFQSYGFSTYEIDGYSFEYWHILGESEQLSTELSFIYVPKADLTIEAVYESDPVDYTITTTSNVEGIVVVVNETTTANDETEYELTAPVNEDYDFINWIDANTEEILSTNTTYTFIATKNQSIEAIYESNELVDSNTIIVTSNIENIVVTVNETITVNEEFEYELIAPVDEDYDFISWIDVDTEEILSTELTYTFISTKDQSIEAIYESNEIIDIYTIIITSNVGSIVVTVNETISIEEVFEYELIAPVHEDFIFNYWIDVDTEQILSTELTYIFVSTKDQSIEAIYELIELTEPTLIYETTFDDASKGAYAEGIINVAGEDWTLFDALLGTLSTDLKISGNSVRIRDGYIQTEFTVTDIAQVIFYAGTYGSDPDTTVNFQISVDKTNWTTVESFTSTGTLELYSIIFDSELISSLGLDTSNAYYIRIESEGTPRTNVDNLQIYTGDGFIADDTPLYVITFTDMANQYLLDDTVDLTGCTATHPIAGATTCDIDGSVDSSIAGVYEVIFSKTDEYGNTAVEIVRITVIDPVNVDIDMDLSSYYDDAEGLYGDALIDALSIIINNGFVGVDYGEARYILDDSDVDPSNPNNVILVYLGTSISGVWDYGATWNREHVWPQSLLGESANNDVVNMASDLYNLMPANPGENSSRGNSPYSALGFGYEPRDEVKGDVARALFYMMVMYDELNLVNTAPGIHEMGYLDELLAWHIADPVDEFELNRLEVIYGEQLNRNPFVDYPHLVDLIWFYDATGE